MRFLLAWTRRDALAGLLAGAAVLVEYQAAGIAVIIGAYVAFRGLARLGRTWPVLDTGLDRAPQNFTETHWRVRSLGGSWLLAVRPNANGESCKDVR